MSTSDLGEVKHGLNVNFPLDDVHKVQRVWPPTGIKVLLYRRSGLCVFVFDGEMCACAKSFSEYMKTQRPTEAN